MGKKYATLKDVAKLAGTTASTVSYVLSGKEGRYISQDMRQRVMKAVEQTGYVKSSAASSLKGKKRGIIAVLVPQFSNQYFTRMILAIEAEVEKEEYILTICNTFDDPKRENNIINRMLQHRVDGYILIPTVQGYENTRKLRKMDVPMVITDRPLETETDYDFVTTDNYACGRLAADYLIENGHRHIVYVDWNSGIHDLERRRTAFLDAVREAGIREEEVLIVSGDFSEETGYELTKQALETRKDVTAVFFGYNIQAKGGVGYLKERGLLPGRDISVILIGSPEWAVAGENDFAHICQQEYEQGKLSAQLLLKSVNETKQKQKQKIRLEPSLYRGSSVVDLRSKHGVIT
ncbi:MAG: LacI family DNA-binding transcriptional regulator [Monoglobales bacterium]